VGYEKLHETDKVLTAFLREDRSIVKNDEWWRMSAVSKR